MPPKISIVMPTHNRAPTLAAVLQALATQTVPPDVYEVVLVADGCTDDTAAIVAAVRSTLPYRLHFIEQSGQGAAAARNHGVDRSAAPIVLFLDDDMRASPTLIEGHLAEHAAAPGSLVLGYFPIPLAPVKHDPFARAARNWWDEGFASRRHPGYRFGFRDFCTGNISLSVETFRAAGGFYQVIKSASGEDWELGYRLLRGGARFRFAQRAESLHQDFTSFDRTVQRTRLEGRAHALTAQRHPELAWSFKLHRVSRLQAFPYTLVWQLLWRHPGVTDIGAGIVRAGAKAARRLGLKTLMYKLHAVATGHAYWQGVRSALPNFATWQHLMQDSPLEPQDYEEIDIDLGSELGDLDAMLASPVDAVRLWWNGTPIGRIEPVAGAERLSPVHVREQAVGRFARRLVDRMPEASHIAADGVRRGGVAAEANLSARAPIKVAQLDLRSPQPVWSLERFGGLQLLVKDGGQVRANVTLALQPASVVLSAEELVAEVARRGWARGNDVARFDHVLQPPISVVVCTSDRPHALRRCLRALSKVAYRDYEVLVVDYSTPGAESAEIVAHTPFRYIREDRGALDFARNTGMSEAKHGIVAYLDEAAVPDPGWLAAIAAAFDDGGVDAVTGLVVAAELLFAAQRAFEQSGEMEKRMERRDFVGSTMTALEKLEAHHVGVGVNMAFRRQTCEGVGCFDTALDMGTPARGGGDIDMFHRILAAGLTIRYEPSAVTWYYPHRDFEQLSTWLHDSACAFGVYLLKVIRSRSVPPGVAIRYGVSSWLGGRLFARLLRTVTKRERLPARVVLAELRGAMRSPWAYRAAYRADRARRRSSVMTSASTSVR